MATSKYDLKNAPKSFTDIYKGPLKCTERHGKFYGLNKLKDESQNTAILVAAGQGSLEAINYLLDLGASIHDKNVFGKSVLHFASAMGHEAAVRLLLKRGADVKATDTSRNTVLHSTAEGGCAEIASTFLNLGIDIQGKNCANETALHYAAKSDNLEVADFLIQRGADVNEKSSNGMTPLLYAIERGSEEVVELLMKHGAEIHAKDGKDSNALHFAAENGNEKLIKLLLNLKIDINEKGFEGRTALHVAAQNGNSRAVGVLLDHGASINAQDCDGRSALNHACRAENERIVQLLLDQDSGIDVNLMDKEGQTALHYACEMGNENIVRLILARGASVTKDNSNKTVLHFSARGGNENIIQLFLNSGIAVDATDKDENTALHLATEWKNLNAVKLLLDSGANVNSERRTSWKYDGNESALTIAIQCDFVNGVKLLLERGANITFHKYGSGAVSKIENENIIKYLLHFGLDDNDIDDDVLSKTFYLNRSLIAEKLFENGEKLGSVLHFPIYYWYMKQYVDESLQIFLDYGLNVNAVGNCGSIVRDALGVENYSAAKILTMHVVKMKNQNLCVNDIVWNDIMKNEQLKSYQKKCEKEMQKMKRAEFYNSTVSCFDVLTTRDPQQLVSYARNKDIIEGLESYGEKKLFPIYFNSLYKQIQRGTWRKLLIEQAGDFFIAVTSPKCTDHQLPKLPATFIHQLSSYLTNKELKMLTRTCKSKFYMDIHDVTKNMIYN